MVAGWELEMRWIWGEECVCRVVENGDVIQSGFRVWGEVGQDEGGVRIGNSCGVEDGLGVSFTNGTGDGWIWSWGCMC